MSQCRVLLGWELGSNYGHAKLLAKLANFLTENGCICFVALQQIDVCYSEFSPKVEKIQAPVWPNCLKDVYRKQKEGFHCNYGEVFDELCLDREHALTSMLECWGHILKENKPDVVIADMAPALLMASREKCFSIRIGTGYDNPPSHLKYFPSFYGNEASSNDRNKVDKINKCLKQADCLEINYFPEIFLSNCDIVGSIGEMDPYINVRKSKNYCPINFSDLPLPMAQESSEIYVYLHEAYKEVVPLWEALESLNVTVRIHLAKPNHNIEKTLESLGFLIEKKPLDFPLIQSNTRLLITNGGHYMATQALLCGIPQIIIHYDIEKSLNGRVIESMNAGFQINIHQLKPFLDRKRLEHIYHDRKLFSNCEKLAVSQRSKVDTGYFEQILLTVMKNFNPDV